MAEKNHSSDEPVIANLEAERQLLGYILLDNETYYQCCNLLKPEYFFAPVHQELFKNIGELLENGKSANPITLHGMEPAEINKQPAQKYYVALCKDPAHKVNIVDYAETIKELSYRRELAAITGVTKEFAATAPPLTPPDDIQKELEIKLIEMKARYGAARIDNRSIEYVCDESLTEFLTKISSDEPIYPTIGLKDVTRLMGPLTPGCVYVLAGRPGSGKTAAAVAAARSIIRQKRSEGQHYGVAFFSLEMTRMDIWARFIASEMALSHDPVNYMNIKRLCVPATQYDAIQRYSNALKKFPLSLDDKSNLTIVDIYARAREEKQRFAKINQSLDVVVIDYLQIIKPTKRYAGNKVAEISEISIGLVNLAKDLNVAVIAVSQLSRKVEERKDKRPIMPDLRESGQIEQDANSIIFLYRPAYYDNQNPSNKPEDVEKYEARQNDLLYIVAKARDGITGEVTVYTDIGKNHIVDK